MISIKQHWLIDNQHPQWDEYCDQLTYVPGESAFTKHWVFIKKEYANVIRTTLELLGSKKHERMMGSPSHKVLIYDEAGAEAHVGVSDDLLLLRKSWIKVI